MRARTAVVIVVIVAAVAASQGDARAQRGAYTLGPSAFFLGADPHIPLAVVAHGRVFDAVSVTSPLTYCGDAQRWAKVRSTWNALDAWGQVVGTVAVQASDPFDMTACAELSFRPTLADDTSHVLVATDSIWQAAPSVEWRPSVAESAAFDVLVSESIPGEPSTFAEAPAHCATSNSRSQFFQVPGGERFAVGTTNTGYVVGRLRAGVWAGLRAPLARKWAVLTLLLSTGRRLRPRRRRAPRDRAAKSHRDVLGGLRAGPSARWHVVGCGPEPWLDWPVVTESHCKTGYGPGRGAPRDDSGFAFDLREIAQRRGGPHRAAFSVGAIAVRLGFPLR